MVRSGKVKLVALYVPATYLFPNARIRIGQCSRSSHYMIPVIVSTLAVVSGRSVLRGPGRRDHIRRVPQGAPPSSSLAQTKGEITTKLNVARVKRANSSTGCHRSWACRTQMALLRDQHANSKTSAFIDIPMYCIAKAVSMKVHGRQSHPTYIRRSASPPLL